MRRTLFIALFTLVACEGRLGGQPDVSTTPGGGADAGCPPEGRNDEIRLALAPACASCHTTGNKPYFASLAAFENGLVYDLKWVDPANPEGSGLVKLLEGTAAGSYPQMPPGEPYAAFLANGRVKLSLDEVKAWIRALPPRGAVDEGPSPEAFTVRRLRADEMVVSLMDQLGLGLEDFVDTSSPDWRNRELTVNGGKLFVWPTDWAPGISQQYVSDKRTTERYETLGGAVILQRRKHDEALGPAAMQTLVQVSQAWCRRAIEKPGNTAVLRHVTLADTSATKAADIRKNIASLSLRMLGDVPGDAEVSELYEQVYLPLESASTKTAWTAVCSALIRHPKWLTY
ncbi:MAG: hypothetical protein ACOZQL_21095 [Myxococcota bacterium]